MGLRSFPRPFFSLLIVVIGEGGRGGMVVFGGSESNLG